MKEIKEFYLIDMDADKPHIILFPLCPTRSMEIVKSEYRFKMSRFISFLDRSAIIGLTLKS